jgi:two-component system LytT family response regulator
MNIRTLIVDDEPLARERIRSLLAQEPDIQIAGECANGTEALAAIKAHSPDLLFLDVQMPGMDGFELLRNLATEQLPSVIFVTAYDQHAVKAFEVHALDYLLKPFKQARFKQTVQRAREALASRQAGNLSKNLLAFLGSQAQPQSQLPAERRAEPELLTRIPVRVGERLLFVKTDQIDYIEAAGNYVVLHAGKEHHVVRETLTALEARLGPKRFLRISRSSLVNVDQIKELQPLFKGEHAVLLHSGKQLTMTRGLREVQELLKFA